jgi:hypothetical protein
VWGGCPATGILTRFRRVFPSQLPIEHLLSVVVGKSNRCESFKGQVELAIILIVQIKVDHTGCWFIRPKNFNRLDFQFLGRESQLFFRPSSQCRFHVLVEFVTSRFPIRDPVFRCVPHFAGWILSIGTEIQVNKASFEQDLLLPANVANKQEFAKSVVNKRFSWNRSASEELGEAIKHFCPDERPS